VEVNRRQSAAESRGVVDQKVVNLLGLGTDDQARRPSRRCDRYGTGPVQHSALHAEARCTLCAADRNGLRLPSARVERSSARVTFLTRRRADSQRRTRPLSFFLALLVADAAGRLVLQRFKPATSRWGSSVPPASNSQDSPEVDLTSPPVGDGELGG